MRIFYTRLGLARSPRQFLSLIILFLLIFTNQQSFAQQCAYVASDPTNGAWQSLPTVTCSQQGPFGGQGAGSNTYYYQPGLAGYYNDFYLASNGTTLSCANSNYYAGGNVGPYVNVLNTWGTSLAPSGTTYVEITTTQGGSWNGSSAVLYYRHTTPTTPSWSSEPNACINTATTYTVNASSYTTYYNWSATNGTINSGQGTTSASITFSASGSQTITVTPYNGGTGGCAGTALTGTITVYSLSSGGTIQQMYSCGGSGYTYAPGNATTVAPVTYATVSGYNGTINQWLYANNGTSCNTTSGWSGWGGAGSTTAPGNCCFNTSGGGNPLEQEIQVTDGVCPTAYSCMTIVIDPTMNAPTGVTVTVPAGGSTVCTGYSGNVTLTASGGNGQNLGIIRWYTGGCGTTLVGTGNPLTVAAGAPTSSVTYYARYENPCGTVTTCATGVLTVVAQPTVGNPTPSSQTVCTTGTTSNITLSSAVSGGVGTATYQWYSSTANNTSGSSMGTTGNGNTATFTPPSTSAANTYYYCVINENPGCSVTTTSGQDAYVSVLSQPTISSQPTASQSVCTGGGVTLSTTLGGGTGNYTYQWYYNGTTNSTSGGTAISGAAGTVASGSASTSYSLVTSNGSSTSPGGTGVTGTYYYYCTFSPQSGTGCGPVSTATAGVTVVAQPTLIQPTASQSVCTGATVTLSATASGAGSYTAQWYYNNTTNSNSGGTAIGSGSTVAANVASTYTLVTNNSSTSSPGGTGQTGTYYYYCTFTPQGTTACGPVTSNTAGVTVVAQPSISTQPTTSQTVCKAASVTLSTTLGGGSGSYTYQWYYNNTTNSTSGGTAISGATGTVASGSASASYSLVTTNTSATSPGGTGFIGGPYYYYCTFTPLSGTACGPVTTTTAAVTTVAVPTISTQPATTQSVCTGGGVTLSTTLGGGTGNYTYQWYYNNTTNSTSGGTAISGATGTVATGSATTTYSLVTNNGSSTSPGGTGVAGTYYYYCTFTPQNSTNCGPVTTTTAGVTIVAQPTLTQPTVSQSVCTGATVTLSATASGTGSYTAQWYYNNTTNSNSGGTAIGSGSTVAANAASTYTLVTNNSNTSSPGGTGQTGTYYYYCTFTPQGTTACGPVTTNTAGVTVVAQPTISTQPTTSQTVCKAASVTLSTTLGGGSGSYTYQWYYNNTTNSTTGGAAISGATGTVASGSASASYSLVTTNTSATSPGGTGFVGGPYYYYCTFTPLSGTACGPVTTTTAAVTIVAVPTISTQPATTQSVCTGGGVTLSTTLGGGTGNYTYQWYYNNTTNSTSGGTAISGATGTVATGSATTTYSLVTNNGSSTSPGGTGVAGTYYYYCTFTPQNSTNCGPVTTTTAGVTIVAQPTLTQPTASQTVCKGATVTLSATASGTGSYTAQWYFNSTNSNSGGTAIGSGATVASGTANTYTLVTNNTGITSPAGTGVAGTFYYYCTFTPIGTTNCGPVTTNTATVIVNLATISSQSANTAVCKAGALTLTATPAGAGTYNYTWYYNNTTNSVTGGTAISGATGTVAPGTAATYALVTNNSTSASPGGTNVTGTYYYYCTFVEVTSATNCGTVTTTAIGVTVNALPSVTITSQGNTQTTPLCADSAVGILLTPTNTGGAGNATYQWQIWDSTGTAQWRNITGATGSTYNPDSLTTSTTSLMDGGGTSASPKAPVGWPYEADIRVQVLWSGSGCGAAVSSGSTFVAPYPDGPGSNGPTVTGCGQATIYGYINPYNIGSQYVAYYYSGTYPGAGSFVSGSKVSSGSDYAAPSSGNYYVTTYSNLTGCNSGADISETGYSPVAVTISPSFTLTTDNPNNGPYHGYGIACSGSTNGKITAVDAAGSPNYPLKFSWSTGTVNSGITVDSNTISGLSSGLYSVTVTDNGGCVQVGNFTLTSPNVLSASTTTASYGSGYGTNCNGAADGSATGAGNGGASSTYTYSWSPTGYTGASTVTYSALPANTYTVTVTDVNSCTASATAVITQPSTITFTYSISYVCNSSGYTSAAITVVPTGGASGTYQAQNNGAGYGATGALTFSGLSNGSSNTIYVRDASYNSCVSSPQTIVITFPTIGSTASNCNYIYVSPSGGGTLGTTGCPTDIVDALTNSAFTSTYSSGRNVILMQAGTYNLSASLTIPANVVIDGGYNVGTGGAWYKATNTATTININPPISYVTANSTTVGAYIGLIAGGNGFELKDITVNVLSGGTSGNYNGYGNSIYGLYLSGQTGFKISRCTIATGPAGAGAAGAYSSSSGGGSSGGAGGFVGYYGSYPVGSSYGGGNGCSANAGVNGTGGTYGAGPYGSDAGGSGGNECTSSGCNTAGCNSNGCTGGNGSAGSAGANAPAYTGQPSATGGLYTYFIPVTGATGYNGDGGGGGGGGGPGEGGTCCSCSCGSGYAFGGRGGDGGAGGAGGAGGYGGGSSFAIYAYGGTGTIIDCYLNPGSGGTGGGGATGHPGAAAAGNQNNGTSRGGCDGGTGGNGAPGAAGGQGGTGQQGANGLSVALEPLNGSTLVQTGSTSLPADGTTTAYMFQGCPYSEITLSKTTSNNWNISGIGTNPLYENNLTSSSSSYSNSTNTAVIYYTSGSGDQNIATTSITLNNFLRLNGTRLVTQTGSTNYISTISSPCPTGTNSPITLTYTSALSSFITAGDIVGYDWEIMNTSAPATVVYSSTAASPGTVAAPSGGWVPGATYQVRLRLQESCCGWSIPMWSSFTVNTLPANAGAITPTTAVCQNATQTYSISSVSNTTGYTWSVTGGTITANSSTTYSTTATSVSIQWGPAGTGTVSVQPYNTCGNSPSATSQNITINGLPLPSITPTSPASAALCTGSATMQVSASAGAGGNGTFNYLWSTSATTTSITATPSGTAPYTTTYSVTVTDQGSGCSASASQLITVDAQPTVSAPSPASQSLCTSGTTTAITASPSGGAGTFAYQWYSAGSNSNSGGTSLGSSSGAQSASYTPPSATAGTTYYYCVITNSGQGCNTVTTPLNDATVIVDAQPSIITPAANTSICPGGSTTMSVVATGGVSITGYQWQYNNSGTWQNVNTLPANITYSGGTTSTLTINSASGVATGTYQYQCLINYSGTGCTSQLTSAAALTVNPQPTITSQPGIALLCIGGSNTLQIVTTGGVNPSYTWTYYNGSSYVPIANNTPSGINYTGVNTNTLTITSASGTTNGDFYYQANVTYVAGTGCTPNTLTSNSYPTNGSTYGVADIGLQPSIVTQPTSVSPLCGGTSASFTSPGTNGTSLSYQWQYFNSGTSSWSNVADNAPSGITYGGTGTSSTLNLSATNSTAPAAYQYRMQLTSLGSNCNTTYSNTVSATVVTSPTVTFTTTPTANTCSGVNVTYTTQASQSNYIWTVPGTAGTDYTITGGGIGTSSNSVTLQWLSAGSKTVTVNYTNAGGCTGLTPASYTTTVSLSPVVTFTASPGANSCANVNVTYTTQSSQTNYTWTVSGTSGTDYTITGGGIGTSSNSVTLQWLTAGSKTVTVNYTTSAGCTGLSAASSTTIAQPPLSYGTASDASGNTQTICYNSAPAGNMVASGATGSASFSYQWYYQAGIIANPNGGTSTSGWTACGAAQGSNFATATFTPSGNLTTTTSFACFVTPGGTPTCGTGTWANGVVQITVEPAMNYGSVNDASGNTQTICYNTAPAGNMVASGAAGSGSFTYQWYYQAGSVANPGGGTSTSGWTACTSTQGSNFATATFTPSGNLTSTTSFACFVTPGGSPGCGTPTWASGVIVITVETPVSSYGAVTASGGLTQTVCINVPPNSGNPITVNGAAGSSGSFTYQWYYQNGLIAAPTGSSTTGWTACGGAQGTGYNTSSFTASGPSANITYACFVIPASPVCGTGQWAANDLQVTVLSTGPTESSSGGANVCLSAPVSLSSTLSVAVSATYQWYSSTSITFSSPTSIPGATSTSYTPPTSVPGTLYYEIVATFAGTGCTPATSNVQTVEVYTVPTAGQSGGTSPICYNTDPGTFTATGSGGSGSFSYQWYNSGGSIPGATSNTYDPGNLTASNSYNCTVTDVAGCGVNSTTAASIVVEPAISYGTAADASGNTQTICNAATPAGTMVASGATGSASFSYQWYYQSGIVAAPSGTSTSGWTSLGSTGNANTSTFTPQPLTASTTYACFVTPGGTPTCGTGTWATGAVQITVEPALSYGTATDASGNTQSICTGSTPAGTMVASGATGSASFSYQWYYQSGIVSAPSGTSTSGWTSLGSTGNANTASFTPQSLTASTTYACFVTPGGSPTCGTATWAKGAIQITVNPLPTATITAGGPTTFCQGGNVVLTASTGASYLWSDAETTQAITVSASGSFTVTVTSGAGCSAASSATVVTVNPLPTPTITAGGATTFCQGGSVTLTSSTGTAYLWSDAETTSAITVSSSGSYTVKVTNANGCTATSSATVVTVNPLPTATITPGSSTTFCQGGSVTLTSSAGTSYLWSDAETTQAITVSASGSYVVTVTNGNGCSAASSATTVTVNSLPTATITAGGATTFCQGGSVTLTSSTGTAYLWSDAETTQAITATASGSYTVNVTNANGCTATSSATVVTVNSLPTATITPGSSTTFCQGGSVTLTSSSGSSYLWSDAETTQAITVSASGSYTVTVTNSNGCSAASSATTVTVNSLPTATITAGGATTFCQGGSVNLTSSTGSSYLWSDAETTQAITVTASGSYVVTVTNGSSCSAASSATVVTVNSLPTATITAGGPTTFCQGGNVVLTSSAGASYLWSNAATTQAITVSASSNNSVTLTDANGCSAASSVTVVTVNSNPTATITAGGATTFCQGGSVTLTSSTGASYLWSDAETTQAITVSASGSFTVTVTNGSSCSAASSATVVTVHSLPTATITAGGATTFCQGGSVNLTSSTGSSYLWSDAETTSTITVSTSGSFTVQVTDANGCSAVSSATTVTANSNPSITFTTSPSANTCAGTNVIYTTQGGESNYTWIVPGTLGTDYTIVSGGVGTGSNNVILQWLTAGSKTVTVNYSNSSGCTGTSPASSTTTVSTNATAYNVTGGTHCGSATIGLDNSDNGVSYQLLLNGSNSGTPVSGTGSAITFGSETGAGTYTVQASGCGSTVMNGSATVYANPASFTVTGGNACSSVTVGLSGSQNLVSYQLLLSGSTNIGSPVTGNSGALNFGAQTTPGTYTVVASNANCSINMSSSATVTTAPNLYTVSGVNTCSGITVSTSGSDLGINYQLKNGNSNVGSAIAGTGSGITFPVQTAPGNYTVFAYSGGCSATMTDTAVRNSTAPTAYTVTGGTNCGSVVVGLSNSQTGFTYQLIFNGTATVGSPLNGTNGSALAFGTQVAAGTYTVTASSISNPCPTNMTGSAVVVSSLPIVAPGINPSPAAGSVCEGTSVSATFNAGQGGIAGETEDTVDYSTNGGITWTHYTAGTSISTSGLTGVNVVQIRTWRFDPDSACYISPYNFYYWSVGTPSAGASALTPFANPICSGTGSTLGFTVSGTLGASSSWVLYDSDPTGSPAPTPIAYSTTSSLSIPQPTVAGSYTYYVNSQSLYGSCITTAVSTAVTVNQSLDVYTTGSTTACSGTAENISLNSHISGTTFSWTVGAVTGGVTGATAGSGNTISDVLNGTGTVTYIVTPQNSGYSTCPAVVANVVVNVASTVVLTSPLTASVCDGIFRYTPTSNVTGATFTWSNTSASGFAEYSFAGADSINDSLVNATSSPIVVTYAFTITTTCAAPQTVDVQVTVYPQLGSGTPTIYVDHCGAGNLIQIDSLMGGNGVLPYTIYYTDITYSQHYSDIVSSLPINITPPDLGAFYSIDSVKDNDGCNVKLGGTVQVPIPVLSSQDTIIPCNLNIGTPVTYYNTQGAGSSINAGLMATIIATHTSLDTTPVNLQVNATTPVFNSQSFMKRNLHIAPANNDTASVTIYISQAEVDSLVEASANDPAPYQPLQPDLSNLQVIRYDGATETPTNYSSKKQMHNSSLTITPNYPLPGVYAITFMTDSFSGFFMSAETPPTAVISGSDTVCAGGADTLTITLTGEAPWNLTYNAVSAAGTVPATITNITSSPYLLIVNPSITTTYTVVDLGDAEFPSAPLEGHQDSAVLTIGTGAALSSPTANTVCNNSAFSYTATSTTPSVSFSWTRAAVAGISNAAASGGSANIDETLINTTNHSVNVAYVFTLSTAGGCVDTQSVVATVDVPTIAAVLEGCSFIDSAHIPVSVDTNMIAVTITGGATPYTVTPSSSASQLRIPISASNMIYTVPANNSLYNYSVTDNYGCTATSNSIKSLNGNPTNIPYTLHHGGETVACYDNGFGKWLTFNDTLNNAVLEIYDSSQSLGNITVTVYKDTTSQYIPQSSGCYLNHTTAMQRHFVIKSDQPQPFTNDVQVRLFFTNTELDSLEQATNFPYEDICQQVGSVKSLNDLFVTKYDGPNEDSLYANNSPAPTGIYSVYGHEAPYQNLTEPNGPLSWDSTGFATIYPNGAANHWVQFSVHEFSELWLGGSQWESTPLPVSLLYLQAEAVTNYIDVSWATAVEINNNYFAIERSTDGATWDSIGLVLGHGNTTTETDYSYNDLNVIPDTRYYYRLKQVDYNGNSKLTGVVSAIINGSSDFDIHGFIPNPATNSTSLVITSSSNIQVHIDFFNIIGQKITGSDYQITKGPNQLQFETDKFASGTYTAVITTANSIYNRKLVITR